MDIFLECCVNPFLRAKERYSRVLAKTSPKAALPLFKSYTEINEYMKKNFIYYPDPPLFDYYTHPETLQYAINTKQMGKINCDCDDYAVYAYIVLSQITKEIQLVNLIIDPVQIWNIGWSHVITTFKHDKNKGYIGVIDTNGLNWFKTEQEIIPFFNNLYKVKYKYYLSISYPF